MNIKNWVVAARLRTLPLSLSAVLAGCFMGVSKSGISAMSLILFILIVMTAVLLQILSNFANDYGDAVSGVDSDNRIGPRRALQNGDMTMSEMKKGIVAVTVMALITGTASLFLAFGTDYVNIAVFVLLGALSVIAAITYTVGLVYGYKGLGDISVFIFFGLVAVMGSSFMLSGNISMESILWGITAGFMATLVLNVNNLRDYESDRVVVLDELEEISKAHRYYLAKNIKEIGETNSIVDMDNIQYFDGEGIRSNVVGTIAGMILSYGDWRKPIIAFTQVSDENEDLKISLRCSKLLAYDGIHFGSIIREVAQSLGGNGGGHDVACGAYIPKEKKDEFLNLMNEKLEGRLVLD